MDLITRKLTLDQVQLPDWAKKVAEDSETNSFVRKGLDVQDLKFVDGERAAIHIITNGNEVDRDGELVVPSGISTKNYERAGKPVCFAHSYHDLPCGSCMWLRYSKADNAIIAKMRFASHQKANDIYEYAKEFGIACSIGFIPYEILDRDMYDGFDFKAINIDPKVAQKAIRTYLRSELLEYSLTPVQSHPGAVQIAVSKGFATDNELKSLGYVYEIIDKEPSNAIQEEIIQETQEAQDSGTISPTQEKEVEENHIDISEDIHNKIDSSGYDLQSEPDDFVIELESKSESEECNCTDSEYDNDTCKACGGKRKPKKEVKSVSCTCPDCGKTSESDAESCGMCSDCNVQMNESSEEDDEEDMDEDGKGCGNKPKKPKKDINELGYDISDEEIENLVQQFEKMLETPIIKEPTISDLLAKIENMNNEIEKLKSLQFKHETNTDIKEINSKIDVILSEVKGKYKDSLTLSDEFAEQKSEPVIEIEIKSQEEYEFDFNKALSIVEKSLDKVINTKYIDVDDLVYESLMKAKGKMFY